MKMLMSQLLGNRYKEWPADAIAKSHGLLLRGGYIRQVASGIYSQLPLAQRISNKIIKIIKEEMEQIGFEEVLMPIVMPKELWEESGRYYSVQNELVRFKDRTEHDMVLGMTHEEAVVQLTRTEAITYTKYPFAVYQVQTKFRDEARPRSGLIRVREFLMKDAYSFHTTKESLDEYYKLCFNAYMNIFKRVGLKNFIAVKSDIGMMGGDEAHEFILLCEIGEDSIAICQKCGYKANVEVADGLCELPKTRTQPREEIYTPSLKTINELQNALQISPQRIIKACIFRTKITSKLTIVFIRGDLEVNESKLKALLREEALPQTASAEINLCWGYIGPVNLNQDQYNIYYDESLRGATGMICGANKEEYHIKGLNITDLKITEFVNLYKATAEMLCPICKTNHLEIKRGIEIGNIFKLGDKYTKAMNMIYTDKTGKEKNPIMGCYGIGVGRLLAAIVEENYDENGPIWPASVAPFEVHIIAIKAQDEAVNTLARQLYEELKAKVSVILDNRHLSAGVQFAEADLVGAPIRIVISPNAIESGEFEISTRCQTHTLKVCSSKIRETVEKLLTYQSEQPPV